MMIIDTFIFYNELELLLFRLEELSDYVDYFVLVESRKSHSGKDKDLFFEKNKHLFKKYLHKIINITIDTFPELPKDIDLTYFNNRPARVNETYQRNSITKGLDFLKLNDNDIIIISDADEIINPKIIKDYTNQDFNILTLEQDFYFYNLSYKYPKIWTSAKMIKYKILKKLSPENVRLSTNNISIKNAGWHFTYFFGSQNIADKIKNFSHQEFNNDFYTNEEYIQECIKNGKYLFDDTKMIYVDLKDNSNLPKNYKLLIK